MTAFLRYFRAAALAAVAAVPAATIGTSTAVAQAMVQSLVPGDADALAAQMRRLATTPQDLAALATAGELSLKLGDLSGAAALFARADKVDPRSGRVKAGMASVLVRSERPGEALRFFDQAASYGWGVDHFAADRGLAYDLVGENERAQRDYRLALQRGADDETVRRYALSLGIAGRRTEALQQLDPLVRRQDRAAWRAQAFVLAMGGDTAGAAKIATAMMPAAMNQGLGAFFQKLPTLSATDRAFAVHFGEIYATPERLADARLTPALTPLTPEAARAPVQLAAVSEQPDRRSRRERERDRRRGTEVAQVAATPAVRMAPAREVVQPLLTRSTPPVATLAQVAPSPAIAPQAMRESDVRVTPAAPYQPPPRAMSPVVTAPAQLATAAPAASVPAATLQPAPATVATVTATAAPPMALSPTQPPHQVASTPVAPVASSTSTTRADAVLARIVASLSIPAAELGVDPVRPDPAPVAVPAAVERAPTSSAGKRVVAEASAKEARDGAVRRVVAARVTGDAEADEPALRTRSGRRGAGAAVLLADRGEASSGRTARRGRSAAAEEADAELTATAPRAARRRGAAVADAAADEATPASTRSTRRGKAAAADDGTDDKPVRTGGARSRAADVEDAPLDSRAKRAADRKAIADKKAAAEKKVLADKAAAEKKAARANPSRIWVQVAGGANEGDLGKAWNAVKSKTPTLAKRTGYSTRLRATNRVLTGPFKTDAEARAFVNQLSKQGLSAFSFTSDAGQEVSKLGGK